MDVQESPVEFTRDFEIFPNPTTDKINILIPELNDGDAKIEIYDMLGRLVLTSSTPTNTEHITTIDLSNFTALYYVIRVSTKRTITSKKINLKGS